MLFGDRFRGLRTVGAVSALLLLVTILPVIYAADGRRNLYVLQAEAFLAGRLDIEASDAFVPYDTSVVDGRRFVAFPPAPAMLLVPFVAVLGTKATNTPLIALAMTLVSVLLLRGILRRLDTPERLHPWLIGAFLLGTPYWYALVRSHDVWFLAHVVAITALLAAIHEALHRRRAWLAGLYLGVAFLSRQFSILTTLFVVVALFEHDPERERTGGARLRKVAAMGASLGVCVAVMMLLNHLRFGSPFDTGYAHMPLTGPFLERARLGLFSAAYIPFNLVYLLLQGFHVEFESADKLTNMAMDKFGTGLLAASPFLFVALYADHRRRLVQAAWVVAAVTAAFQIRYISNGFVQFNVQRYTLDYWPLLILLVAMGLKEREQDGEERLWLGAMAYAVGLNAFTIGLRVLNPLLDRWVALF